MLLCCSCRVRNHAQLKPIIEKWLEGKTVQDTVELFLNKGIPAAPINTIDQVVADPHIAGDREMFVEVEHPVAGVTKLTGCHIKMTDTMPSVKTAAPTLGQHNYEVLQEYLGISRAQADELVAQGVM